MSFKKIIWLSSYPAHYTIEFHRKFLEMYPNSVNNVIFGKRRKDRNYEKSSIGGWAIEVKGAPFTIKRLSLLISFFKSKENLIVIHGLYPKSLFFSALLSFLYPCKKAYFSDENISSVKMGFIKKTIYKIFLSKISYLFIMGKYNALFYRNLMGMKRFNQITKVHFPYPYNDIETKSTVKTATGKINFLYLGRLISVKKIDNLIRGCQLLVDNGYRNFVLHIYGSGIEKGRLMRLKDQLNLSEYIIFHGSVPSQDVGLVYMQNDVFVLPSDYEPWGLVCNEALSWGLPVISPFWVGSVGDLVIPNLTGQVILDNSPELISKGMLYYLSESVDWEKINRECKEVVSVTQKNADCCLKNLRDLMK